MLGHLVYTGHDEYENWTVGSGGWLTRLMRVLFGKA